LQGRSPGSRVVATSRLPSLTASGISEGRSPHTVAGAAEVWGANLVHPFPILVSVRALCAYRTPCFHTGRQFRKRFKLKYARSGCATDKMRRSNGAGRTITLYTAISHLNTGGQDSVGQELLLAPCPACGGKGVGERRLRAEMVEG
jgi:hypothetical protein